MEQRQAYLSLSGIAVALIAVFFSLNHESIVVPSFLQFLVTPPTVVDATRNITYIGASKPGVEHFQNIFYAAAPTGIRRFAPPEALTLPPGTVVDATEEGAWCPQGLGDILPFTSYIENIDEDCLSLRVARPKGTLSNASLPVMVWLFSGGNALGSAYEQLYIPDGLVRQSVAINQPVIYVALNYRVGIFGFAASDALKPSGGLNVGLKDQRMALEWVRDNIANFGGNPNNVTAFGHSVGAVNIGLHLTSYAGEKGVPFQKAVMMSGGTGTNFNIKSNLAAENTIKVARNLSCIAEGDSKSISMIDCLRDLPMETLNEAAVSLARTARPPFGEMVFSPTYDNDFIRDRPSALLRAGRFVKDVPLILSWTANDGAWYASTMTASEEELLAKLRTFDLHLSPKSLARLLELYPTDDFEHMVRFEIDGLTSPQYYRAAQIMRDLWFTCPVLDFGAQYARHGQKTPGVWLYEMNTTQYGEYYEKMGVPMWRVAHLSDIPFVFNTPKALGLTDKDAQSDLARRISSSVVKFAYSGSPAGGKGGFSKWPLAFPQVKGRSDQLPDEISVMVAGGPHVFAGPRTVRRKHPEAEREEASALLAERLFERCDFINSKVVQSEIGV